MNALYLRGNINKTVSDLPNTMKIGPEKVEKGSCQIIPSTIELNQIKGLILESRTKNHFRPYYNFYIRHRRGINFVLQGCMDGMGYEMV